MLRAKCPNGKAKTSVRKNINYKTQKQSENKEELSDEEEERKNKQSNLLNECKRLLKTYYKLSLRYHPDKSWEVM